MIAAGPLMLLMTPYTPLEKIKLDLTEFDGWSGSDIPRKYLEDWFDTSRRALKAPRGSELNFLAHGELFEWRRMVTDPYYSQPQRVIDQATRLRILRRQQWKCNACGVTLKFSYRSKWEGEVAHIDHIHPFALRNSYMRGPTLINEDANLQALCPDCNRTKATRVN